METKRKKKFFASHSKSSAMLISLILHGVLLVVALSFVAVTVVTKSDKKFEAPKVNRPRLPPKKLQVPVKMKKKRPKPKLRKQITVKTRMDRKMPDIKMPEISGIKGGLGSAGGGGLGGAAGVGFSMPEIEVFGVKSKGEKVFIALDSDAYIMRDEVGGMRAYQIIKEELVKIIEGFPPTTLFNLAVFDHGGAVTLFPRLVPSTRENTAKIKGWLEPLNAVSANMKSTDYGIKTVGKGGTRLNLAWNQMAGGVLEQKKGYKNHGGGMRNWCRPAAAAMVQQADTVFILGGWWGVLRRADGPQPEWKTKDKWYEFLKKAQVKFKEENRERLAAGEPPKVIRDNWHMMAEYYPDQHAAFYPPQPPWYYFTSKDYAEVLKKIREENAPNLAVKSGISKRKKDRFSVNVVFFSPQKYETQKEADSFASQEEKFKMLARRCDGNFRVIKGLEAIEGSVR